jgi:hypothetical protein
MFGSTLTVDAHGTLADAVARIEGIGDDLQVVVRRRTAGLPQFFLFRAKVLRKLARKSPTVTAEIALKLSSAAPSRTVAVEDATSVVAGPVVVLDGDSVAGVILGASGDRGGGAPAPALPTAPPSLPRPFDSGLLSSVSAGGAFAGPDGDVLDMVGEILHGGAESADNGDAGDVWSGGAAGLPTDEGAPVTEPQAFEASANVSCPSQAAVGEPFDVVVWLDPPPSDGIPPVGIRVPTDLAEFDLVVTIAAPGFHSARMRDVLHVFRSEPGRERVTFTLTPDEIEGDVISALLRVDFSFGGVPCGTAWHSIVVTSTKPQPEPGPAAVGPPTRTTEDKPDTAPPLPVTVVAYERPPDLIITISESDDSTQLSWQFTCRDAAIAVPDTAVTTRFQQQSARSFAFQQVRRIHESIGDSAIDLKVAGVSRTIADQIPPEAWQVLSAVWAKATAEDRLPGVLIVSTDAYVPWELASTEDVYVDQALTDPTVAPILGAQVPISRWNVPNARGVRGVLSPPQPPPESLDVRTMALVIGDYLVESGQRDLPLAKEEGNELAALYSATRLTATVADIDPLFDGELERDGSRIEPDLVHFACHGEADANPHFNGIILNQGNVRLNPVYVAGRRRRADFIFLNACQVGQNTELLAESGGFATQFLNTGAGGFVAPLWNVDDQLAKDTAVAFYEATLGPERVTVAEALRRRRALYDPNAAVPQPTHLAYVYYGHPNLILNPHPPIVDEGGPA